MEFLKGNQCVVFSEDVASKIYTSPLFANSSKRIVIPYLGLSNDIPYKHLSWLALALSAVGECKDLGRLRDIQMLAKF